MGDDFIDTQTLRRVAETVFGVGAEISCVREIGPSTIEGVTERPPSTRNMLYVVEIEGRSRSYVFRFSRVDDDVYEREARNYQLLAERTGVRVPTIYRLDTSREIVPTSYMVMDYLPGKRWNYEAHPMNADTDDAAKAAIGEIVGQYYARAHQSTIETDDPGAEAQTILYTMDRLEIAARRGTIDVRARDIDRCRRAVLDEPTFRSKILSLCLADTEIHVCKEDQDWNVAFACDAEWVEFRHPFSDLAQMLAGPQPWWKLDQPAARLNPDVVADRPFFRGYDQARRIDYEELLRLANYYQLGLWAYVAMNCRTDDEKNWMTTEKAPLISELIRLVSERTERARSLAR